MKFKLTKEAGLPMKASHDDAGYDLCLIEDVKVKKGVTVIDTGVHVELPKGYAGILAPRSSFAKTGIILQ